MTGVPSLKSIAAIRLAVWICTSKNIKKELLASLRNELKSRTVKYLFHIEPRFSEDGNLNIVKDNLHLPKTLLDDVTYHVPFVARRMLRWCSHQYLVFGLELRYCFKVLDWFCFSMKGRLDAKMAAEGMVKDARLDVCQRFRIACFYLLERPIRDLWTLMTSKQRRSCDSGGLQELDKLWSLRLTRETERRLTRVAMPATDIMSEETLFWNKVLYRSAMAANDVAVKSCYHKLHLDSNHSIAWTAATTFLRHYRQHINSWRSWNCCNQVWHFLPDSVFELTSFLLTKMTEDQKEMFFREDIEPRLHYSGIFGLLLSFHCGDLVLELVRLSWGILPEQAFARLLKSLDSRAARELWCESPEKYKGHVLRTKAVFTEVCIELDQDVLDVILAELSLEQQSRLLFSSDGTPGTLARVFALHKYDTAINLVKGFDFSQVTWRTKIKKELDLYFSHEFDHFSNLSFSSNGDLSTFGAFLQLCFQFDDDVVITDIKKRFGYHVGMKHCWNSMVSLQWKQLTSFMDFCFSSSEDASDFKKAYFEKSFMELHFEFSRMQRVTEMDSVFTWFGLSPAEVRDHKAKALVEIFGKSFRDTVVVFGGYIHGVCNYPEPVDKVSHLKDVIRWHLEELGAIVEFQEMVVNSVMDSKLLEVTGLHPRLILLTYDWMMEHWITAIRGLIKDFKRKRTLANFRKMLWHRP